VRGQINANPAELEQAAKRLDVVVENIIKSNRNLAQARGETLYAWHSSLTKDFCRSVDATGTNISTCERQVREVARVLRSTATEVRLAEQDLARRKQKSRSR